MKHRKIVKEEKKNIKEEEKGATAAAVPSVYAADGGHKKKKRKKEAGKIKIDLTKALEETYEVMEDAINIRAIVVAQNKEKAMLRQAKEQERSIAAAASEIQKAKTNEQEKSIAAAASEIQKAKTKENVIQEMTGEASQPPKPNEEKPKKQYYGRRPVADKPKSDAKPPTKMKKEIPCPFTPYPFKPIVSTTNAMQKLMIVNKGLFECSKDQDRSIKYTKIMVNEKRYPSTNQVAGPGHQGHINYSTIVSGGGAPPRFTDRLGLKKDQKNQQVVVFEEPTASDRPLYSSFFKNSNQTIERKNADQPGVKKNRKSKNKV